MPSTRPRPPSLRALSAALLLFPLAAPAAGTAAPDTGTILQQVKPAPAQPAPQTKPGLKIESPAGRNVPPGQPFAVKTITLSGNTRFDTATLHALVAAGEGKTIDLAQLDKLAQRITDYYQQHGYPLARAVIPAQTIHNGVVKIEIVEARYGRIRLDNHSRVHDDLLQATLAPLQGGALIKQARLNHTLLLLSDMPGVSVNATLRPGDTVGTSDLQVQTASPAFLTGSLTLDNYGNRYTGRVRGGGTLYVINPLHHGDLLDANILSSGSGLVYGRIGYQTQLNGYGTRLGGALTAVHYALGNTLKALGSDGNAYVGNLWVQHPFIRSLALNLYGRMEYQHKWLHDRIKTGSVRNDRELDVVVFGLSGNRHDDFLAGGITSLAADVTGGRVHFDDAVAAANDRATVDTQGGFLKWGGTLSRLQTLTPADSLYLSIQAQWANGNLDSSEQMLGGGPYSVRAYDIGALSGDAGYQGTIELRHNFGAIALGTWQGRAFIESAHLTINQDPWSPGPNSATLSGAGVELDWQGSHRLTAALVVATPFGGTPALLRPQRATRAWVEVSERF